MLRSRLQLQAITSPGLVVIGETIGSLWFKRMRAIGSCRRLAGSRGARVSGGFAVAEVQRRSAAAAIVAALAALLAFMSNRAQQLLPGTGAAVDKTALAPYRHGAQIIVMTTPRRLTEGGHDLPPVRAVSQRLASMDEHGNGMGDFVGDGLIDETVLIMPGDLKVEPDSGGYGAPWAPGELNLTGTAAGQVKLDRRQCSPPKCVWKQLRGLLPVVFCCSVDAGLQISRRCGAV